MTTRKQIMAKLDQLNAWAEQLGEYMDAAGNDLANARVQLRLMGDMMELNAKRALDEDHDRNEPLSEFLRLRREQVNRAG